MIEGATVTTSQTLAKCGFRQMIEHIFLHTIVYSEKFYKWSKGGLKAKISVFHNFQKGFLMQYSIKKPTVGKCLGKKFLSRTSKQNSFIFLDLLVFSTLLVDKSIEIWVRSSWNLFFRILTTCCISGETLSQIRESNFPICIIFSKTLS